MRVLVISRRHVDIEYDSQTYHNKPEAFSKDIRSAHLEAEGYHGRCAPEQLDQTLETLSCSDLLCITESYFYFCHLQYGGVFSFAEQFPALATCLRDSAIITCQVIGPLRASLLSATRITRYGQHGFGNAQTCHYQTLETPPQYRYIFSACSLFIVTALRTSMLLVICPDKQANPVQRRDHHIVFSSSESSDKILSSRLPEAAITLVIICCRGQCLIYQFDLANRLRLMQAAHLLFRLRDAGASERTPLIFHRCKTR